MMLKKYIFVVILIGTIVLAGCINDEKTDNEEQSKALTDGQTSKNEKSSVMDNVAEAPTPLDLTPEQKEEYYKEYIFTVDKVNSEYDGNLVIEPITQFSDDYWIEVLDFEKMLKERLHASIIVSKNKDAYAPSLVPKTVELKLGSEVAFISLEGSFETQLNSNTPNGRQLFSAMNSISSKIENDSGNWQQTGYDYTIVDDGRSYLITVGGKYSENGVSSSHLFEVEFFCNENGGIS